MIPRKDSTLAEQADLNREFAPPRDQEWQSFFAALIVFTFISLLNLQFLGWTFPRSF
jgi:hypothetical protein